jgi:serine/threonine-protein kinase RsbW
MVEILLSLCLPRDVDSVPVARHIVRHALAEVGVTEDCTHDVELALSEACSNVLLHAGPGEEYDVRLELDERSCELRIVDAGKGFGDAGKGFDVTRGADLDPRAERGRGLGVMSALVDNVRFVTKPTAGTVVHLHKRLAYVDDSLGGRQLSDQDQGS